MARVTVEDCVDKVDNRFELVLLASHRARLISSGAPLTIETVDLEGPKFGEVLVEIKASGVCHTDEFTRSGGDPEGLFPVIFGHEKVSSGASSDR